MKILITGSNGLLGQKLLHTFPPETGESFGVDLAENSFVVSTPHHYHKLDISDRKATQELVKSIAPEVIIHTAAMTDVDKSELDKETCWKINVSGTDNLVNAASRVSARLIFISTDYVFDGSSGPYNEEDQPNPTSYYGRSKHAGENLLRGSGLDWTIVRTIVLYGVGVNIKSSFITWLLSSLRAGRSVRIVNDQWGNSTIVDDLAAGIERLIMLKRNGIYHIGGRGFMSRCDFALKAAEVFNLNPSLISPITTDELKQPAKRPLRSGLEIDKAERELFLSFKTVGESLELYRRQEGSNGLAMVKRSD